MYPDAITIGKLALELSYELKNKSLKEIFSTSKTDIYFIFSTNKGFKVQFFHGQGFFSFFDNEQLKYKNKLKQFPSAHALTIVAVNGHKNSRSFDLELSDGQRLVFKLFGKFSNIILFDSTPKELFCSNFKKDLETPYSSYINPSSEQSENEKAEVGDKLTQFYINKNANNSYELSSKPNENEIASYPKITEALNDFTKLFIASESFKIKKQSQTGQLKKLISQKQKLYNQTLIITENLKQKRSYSQLADMLMANLHSIHAGTSKVEVFDFYNNCKLMIKIKSNLSPQQNAAIYYQKAKNEVKELEFKNQSLAKLKLELESLNQSLIKLNGADDSKKLKLFDKSDDVELSKAGKEKKAALPYRAYKIGEFDVLVGKNAKANDELLSKFAHKNDTWFHAKGVSGSHVLIKNQGQKPIPAMVIEQAASLAAWYSKAKGNKLASVTYTLRKYVRKPKGAPPGQVIVEREKGILVKPEDFKN